jgi:hypothetical protein
VLISGSPTHIRERIATSGVIFRPAYVKFYVSIAYPPSLDGWQEQDISGKLEVRPHGLSLGAFVFEEEAGGA